MRSDAASAETFASIRIKSPVPDVLLSLCEIADSPRSLTVWLLYQAGEFRQLIELECNPLDYEPVFHTDSYKLDYACVALLSKFENFDIGIDRTAVAFQKWEAVERRCATINQRFRDRWSGKSSALFPHHVEEVHYLARCKIQSMLREVDYEYVKSHCHFGPGADLDTSRSNTTAYHKFSSFGSCTPWIIPLYDDIFSNEESDFRGEYVHGASLCTSSRLSFVPKNAKTDRAICVEPRWNIFLQLGIGSALQQRLLRAGIDITTQHRNQRSASRAYADGLATIDLSSASDSISTNLVVDLLEGCDDWLDLLLKSRCPSTTYQGRVIRLEKISSMGNGYTFPLETLIFYAYAFACTKYVLGREAVNREDVLAYGDDLIVPQAVAPLLIEVLDHVGFSTNKAKTYVSGNFFESCGSDFYRGADVRPFFIKKDVVTIPRAFALCNQIADYSSHFDGRVHRASREVWSIRQHVVKRIPRALRAYGPSEAGSGLIHSTFDVAKPRIAASYHQYSGWEGYLVNAWVPVPVKKTGFHTLGHLFSKLSSDLDSRQSFTTRDDVEWRRKVVYVPTYTDYILI